MPSSTLTATTATLAAETHLVDVYPTRPDLASSAICSATVSMTAEADLDAAANKVVSVVSGPTPPQLGGIVTISVEGDTGAIGAAGIYTVSPASYSSWPPTSTGCCRARS
jgi:hypothetical protein